MAGSDASGGAGIQADLKTFHALRVYGMSAITALTAQSTMGVAGILPVEAEFVTLQIDTAVRDIPPDAVKTGMLARADIVEAVAEAADRHRFPAFVVDPVIVATTGALLLDADGVEAVRGLLIPRATIVTPNAPEAAELLGMRVVSPADQEEAARALVEDLGAGAALVKGGDLEGDEVVDAFFDGERLEAFRGSRIATTSTHGSGCALASAIAAHLARGAPLLDAVAAAREWVRGGIENAPGLGQGRGPLDLFPR